MGPEEHNQGNGRGSGRPIVPRDKMTNFGATITVPASRAYTTQPQNAFNWEQAARILRKNRVFLLAVVLLGTMIFAGYAFRIKDSYQPVASLQIDPPGSGALSLRDAENSIENNQEYLETQAEILRSDQLATLVIRSLHLDQKAELVGDKNLKRYAKLQLGDATDAPMPGETLLQEQFSAAERTPLEKIALRVFHDHLSVSIVRGSRLVEVSFAGNNPRLAQQVTNNLISQFIDQNFKTQYVTTMQASDWLSSQLNDIRQKVEESNQAVVDYQKRYGLVEEDDKDGPSIQLANSVSHQVSEAAADRIQQEAYVRMIDTGQAQSLPQVHSSLVYQSVTTQLAEASAKLAEAKAIYGVENSNYKKRQNEVNELAAQREAEEERIVNQVRTAYSAAREREDLMLASMSHLKSQMGDTSEKMVRYRVLKNDAKANSDLYNTLLARLKEAGVYAGLKSSNIRVVDAAAALDKPTGPHRALIIAAGALFSGIFGLVFAFGRENLTNTIRTPDDIRAWTGFPSLTMIPLIRASETQRKLHGSLNYYAPGGTLPGFRRKEKRELPKILSRLSHTLEAEALRELRNAILFSREQNAPKVILVASSAAGEGKSTVALNLAIALSQCANTCLMDGDLRRPMVSSVFGPAPATGWTHVVIESCGLERALIHLPDYPNMCLLSVGRQPANPGELLASEQLKTLVATLRLRFEYVVIDSPPAIPFSDARLLSLLSDGVVVVGRYGLTTRRALTRCVERLQEFGASILGVVVNGMDFSSADYQYYNFGYSSGKLHGNGYYSETAGLIAGESAAQEKTKGKAAGA